MIASLPMYDFPHTAAANDAFWDLIRANLGYGPQKLTRGGDLWQQWRAPDLALSQTCGFPYRARLSEEVGLVGTPDYGLDDCPPGHYFSVILARNGRHSGFPASGYRLAYNDALSQSGWAAAHAYAEERGTALGRATATGSHRSSALAVAEDRADVAFVDAVTWRHIGSEPAFDGIAVIGRTPPTPGLPLITAKTNDADEVAMAVSGALEQAGPALLGQLGIRELVRIPREAYLAVPTPPPPPASAG